MTRAAAAGFGVVLALAGGCGEPASDDACDGAGDVVLTARPNRLDLRAIDDDSEVPVFPPPQGGVFTELDVAIAGVAIDDLDRVRVGIDDDSGAPIATQEYNGAGLPLVCQSDETIGIALVVADLPVGFDLSAELTELDGMAATLRLGVDTPDGATDVSWSVVLRQTQ